MTRSRGAARTAEVRPRPARLGTFDTWVRERLDWQRDELHRDPQRAYADALEVHRTLAPLRDDALLAYALLGLSRCELRLTRLTEMRAHIDQAVSLFRGLGDRHGEALARNGLAYLLGLDGKLAQAFELMVELNNVFMEFGDVEWSLITTANMAYAASEQGDETLAVQIAVEALRRYPDGAKRHPREMALLLGNLSSSYLELRQPDEALEHARASAALCQQLGLRNWLVTAWVNEADALARMGHGEQGLAMLVTCQQEPCLDGDQRRLGQLLRNTGEIRMALGDARAALRDFLRTWRLLRAYGDVSSVPRIMLLCGQAWAALGRGPHAVRLVEQAQDQARALQLLPAQAEAARMLSDLWAGEGRHEQALRSFRSYQALRQRLRNTRQDVIVQMQRALHGAARAQEERRAEQLRQQELEARREELERQAGTDPLTGLANRRACEDTLSREIAAAWRLRNGLAVILIDLDRFKAVNDTHGHAVGDAALRGAAQLLRAELPQDALLGRWGGEELLVVLHVSDAADAGQVAERLRRSLDGHDWTGLAPGLHLTLSAGVALHAPGESSAGLMRRADQEVYAAKHAGRNQVRLADPPDPRR